MKLIKTLSCRWGAPVLGLGLFLSASPVARANISVAASDSFSDLWINPVSGTVTYTSPLQTSAFAEAGAQGQYDSSSASATDAPVTGGVATGGAAASLAPFGAGSATGFIPGAESGFDTSEGQGSASGIFEITGATGPVSVTLSALFTGDLDLSDDAYGIYGRGQTVLTVSLDGTPTLFTNSLLTIGPSQSASADFSGTLTGTMTLMANTPYYLYAQADAEAEVINGGIAAPDSMGGGVMAGCLAMSALLLFVLRRRDAARAVLLGVTAAGLVLPAQAMYIGGEKPDPCPTCGKQRNRLPGGTANTSVSEGNQRVDYPVVTVKSAYGPTLPFGLTYNSYNADGSRAQVDTGMGYGWTHSYNIFLFSQLGAMFRFDDKGRVTKYDMNFSSPGTYTSDTGYFETMTQQPDGSFIITNKYQTSWRFASVPHTPFFVEGPVWRLTQIEDRNGNTTTMAYDTNGLLTRATDPFGRTLQFVYDSSNHLSDVTDPMGRITQFQYDSQNRELTQITDPQGNTTKYTYNSEYQMTRKVDPSGRMYFYTYKSLLPYMVTDGSGQPYLSMSNPTNWSVNETNLAFSQERSYNPSTTTVTDGRGNTWQYAYDPNGYITQTTAPDGSTTRYTYDPATLGVASMTDPDGNTTRWTYDPDGNRISATDALGDVTTWTYDPTFNEVTSMTDPLGRVTDWTYDGNGNQITTTDPLGQTERWTYDPNGNVLTHTDKRGNTTTNAYDSFGERISSTDPLGDITRWTYDPAGNILSMTDPLGRVTDWTYDELDRRISMTDALGGTTHWTYDPQGNMLSTTDPNTNTTLNQYDDRSRIIENIDPLEGVRQWTYDPNDNVITSSTPNGNVTTNAYDTQNRKIETIDPLGGTTHWTYDPQGNRLSTTDPNTNTARWTYDSLNRKIGMTNALGGVTLYYYDMAGSPVCCSATPGTSLLLETQDADGNITFYHYDELNRRTQVLRKNSDANNVINPTDAVTTTAYDADDNVVATTDPNTNTTTYAYDAVNRRISMINAAGDTTLYSYDGAGNALTVTAPNENTTTNFYDGLNRVIAAFDEIGLVRSNSYDPVGNQLTLTDGLGHTTSYTYDGLNRQTSTTDALGHTSATSYDADSNVTSITDRNGNTTRYFYDGLDRRVSLTDALGDTTLINYDSNGNVIGRTDANGHTTSYRYDGLNRQITEIYPDPAANTVSNFYDAVGNIIQRIDPKGQVITYSYNRLYYMTNRAYLPSGSLDSFIYDDGGRMLGGSRNGWVDTFTYDGANRLTNTVQNGRVLTYTYDIPGRTQTNTQPSGRILNYAYDARNRLAALSDTTSNPPIATYIYDDANRVMTRTYRNATTATYTYNANDWITSLNHSNATGLVAGFSYAYDNEGNKLFEQKSDNPPDSSAYAYDALYRMTNYDVGALSNSVVPSPSIAKTWVLDPVGNWNNLISNAAPDVRTYGPGNELLTDNGSNYLHDADGNTVQDNSYNYSYDEENRLIQVQRLSDSTIVGQYVYDALGRRVEQIANPSGTSATNYFYYDRKQIIEEQSGGATTASYTYGHAVDNVLAMDRGGQTYYYQQNALWSAHALTDATGAVAERYAYDAYGHVTVLDASYAPRALNSWGTPHSAITNCFLFTGRELDEETGLYFYRARFYDGLKGRFLERDRLEYLDGMNLFEYVGDNPANFRDPTGNYACCAKWKSLWEQTKYKDVDDCALGLIKESDSVLGNLCLNALTRFLKGLGAAGAAGAETAVLANGAKAATGGVMKRSVGGPIALAAIVWEGAEEAACQGLLLSSINKCSELDCVKSYPATVARTGRWRGNPLGNWNRWWETVYSCKCGDQVVEDPFEKRSASSDPQSDPSTITKWE